MQVFKLNYHALNSGLLKTSTEQFLDWTFTYFCQRPGKKYFSPKKKYLAYITFLPFSCYHICGEKGWWRSPTYFPWELPASKSSPTASLENNSNFFIFHSFAEEPNILSRKDTNEAWLIYDKRTREKEALGVPYHFLQLPEWRL